MPFFCMLINIDICTGESSEFTSVSEKKIPSGVFKLLILQESLLVVLE